MSIPHGPLSEQQAAIAKFHREGQAVTLWTVGIVCIYGWDYLICLHKEIKYIWRKKLSYMSALYAANRYFGLVLGAVTIWIMEISNTGSQAYTCKGIFRWQPVGAMISTLLSQAIMASRVYALYGLSNVILVVLATIMAAEFAVETYTLTIVFPAPSPSDVVVPCVAIAPFRWLVAFWSMPLLFDTITFVLTLVKTFLFWKQEIHTPTVTLIFRDGLIYFAAVFSMNLINVILFVTQDAGLQAVNLPATTLLNVIMSCRLVLNLRKPRATVHMTGVMSSLTTTEAERQADFWSASLKPRSNSYELSGPAATPSNVGVTIQVTRADAYA